MQAIKSKEQQGGKKHWSVGMAMTRVLFGWRRGGGRRLGSASRVVSTAAHVVGL